MSTQSAMDSMSDVRGPDIDIDALIKEDTHSFNFIFSILRFLGIRLGGVTPLYYLVAGYCASFVGLQLIDLFVNSNLDNRAENGKFFAACFCALTQYFAFYIKSDQLHLFQKLSMRTNKFMLSQYKYFYELSDPTTPFETTQKAIWSSYKKWYIGILITYLFVFIFSNMPGAGGDGGTCHGRLIWNLLDCRNPVNFFIIFIFQNLFCGTVFLHVLWGFAAFRINVTLNMITQIRFLHNFIEKIGVRRKPVDSRTALKIGNIENPSAAGIVKASKLQPLTKEALARQLDICIKFHNFIQKEQDILNDIFSAEVLVEFVGFAFLNCLTIFQAFSERQVSRLFTLAIFLCFGIGYLYSICEMGSALRFQCAYLTKAAYQCKWCTFEPPERRTVIMIIHKAQRTKYLRGGKVFDISVQTFVQLVRMSYSLLLFLFNMQSTNRI